MIAFSAQHGLVVLAMAPMLGQVSVNTHAGKVRNGKGRLMVLRHLQRRELQACSMLAGIS